MDTDTTPPKLIRVYDLHHDRAYVESVQTATLTSKDFGLVPEHGLFGSDEWWLAVDSGDIAVRVTEGEITDVFDTGHRDYPVFALSGRTWTRQTSETDDRTLTRPEKWAAFRKGVYARVRFAIQRHRRSDWGLSECVLSIDLGMEIGTRATEMARRSSLLDVFRKPRREN